MKPQLPIVTAAILTCLVSTAQQSQNGPAPQEYWNIAQQIAPFRLPPPPAGFKPEYLDLNGDGKVDAIKTITHGERPVLWLDDDGSMRSGDTEGNMVNSCLLVDRHKTGRYDLVIKWADIDGDNSADLQLIAEYPKEKTESVWPNGHYMIVFDPEKDNIFNYIDWNTFTIECWERFGICDFFTDYSGQSAFVKIHTSTYDVSDLRLSWENPFLFYDPDRDGLSETAIRMLDTPPHLKGNGANTYENMQLTGKIDWVSMAYDLDNDNGTGNDFDFDFTLGFAGEGFDYTDQVHPLKNMRGLAQADKFFIDPRFRNLTELVFPGHDSARELIFKRGRWNRAFFVYDEDDDCNRWERVEFCDDRNPFIAGSWKGGMDHNSQTDIAGDRGEWDRDFSGDGKLYIGRFDGRLHLYGAETGLWRMDQLTRYYQGWDKRFQNSVPEKFGTVRYFDRDGNGFFDSLEYDLDGDHTFETTINLTEMGVDDRGEVIDISGFTYGEFTKLARRISDRMWKNGAKAVEVAGHYGLSTAWYAKLKEGRSVRERYDHGYWLQFYIYKDMEHHFISTGQNDKLNLLHKAYLSSDWNLLR